MRFDAHLVGDITIESAKDLCAELLMKPPKDTTIFLSSEGGDVNGALTIGAAIQRIQRAGKEVHIHVGGCAYSSGVLLLQFATRRTMEPYTAMLVHPAAITPIEKAEYRISDLNGLADDLCYAEHCYFEVLQRRTGFDLFELLNRAHYRRQEVILYPQDCLRWNLVDEVLEYALPEVKQKTRVPGDDDISNVVHLDTSRSPASPVPKASSRRRTRRKAS